MFSEIDLSDPKFAEAIYIYCTEEHNLNAEELQILITSDLSLAEFVQNYKYKSFCLWYRSNYAIE